MLLDLGLPAALIGGIVLPLLGAVPDSAMIIASGVGGNKQQANKEIAVGMGYVVLCYSRNVPVLMPGLVCEQDRNTPSSITYNSMLMHKYINAATTLCLCLSCWLCGGLVFLLCMCIYNVYLAPKSNQICANEAFTLVSRVVLGTCKSKPVLLCVHTGACIMYVCMYRCTPPQRLLLFTTGHWLAVRSCY